MPGPFTHADIDAALRQCIDPELGIDIVSLGLIYNVEWTEDSVTITMTLTTPGCPLVPYFKQRILDQVRSATGTEQVNIVLTFDPPWSPERMTPEGKKQLTMLRG